jgi:hypothetical protein
MRHARKIHCCVLLLFVDMLLLLASVDVRAHDSVGRGRTFESAFCMFMLLFFFPCTPKP